ncbi:MULTISPECIES: helix-turn-helix transcriptional regulator [Burkholderiaceae]|uniref:helix-turn-helix domain-containing protein n=1 Tax=Burkholderiaceae TaxID=119060 RepID=UPI000D074093|nr:helix-turn-helix transcriptional regulator [Paraburkholderia fungorum]
MDEIDNKMVEPWLRQRLAKNLRRQRQERKISQEKLSDRCGFHRSYISQVERGVTNITIDNVQRIAEALETDPQSLFQA